MYVHVYMCIGERDDSLLTKSYSHQIKIMMLAMLECSVDRCCKWTDVEVDVYAFDSLCWENSSFVPNHHVCVVSCVVFE